MNPYSIDMCAFNQDWWNFTCWPAWQLMAAYYATALVGSFAIAKVASQFVDAGAFVFLILVMASQYVGLYYGFIRVDVALPVTLFSLILAIIVGSLRLHGDLQRTESSKK